MSTTEFQAKRMTKSYRQTIDAAPEVVFPLLCPVREAEWLDGWEYSMIYSVSGLVEEGAVFSTTNAGEDNTVWVVTRYVPEARLVEFTRFTPRCKTCVLRIGVAPVGDGRSYVDVSYTYTSIASAGEQFLESWTDQSFRGAVVFWEQSMNHFLKTGSKLLRVAG